MQTPYCLLLGVSVVNFACFGYSIVGVFRSWPQRRATDYNMLKGVSVACYVACVAALVTSEVEGPVPLVGLTAALLANGLFWSAALTTRRRQLTLAFSEDAPTFIERRGPYRLVRHPFYAAYLLAYLAVWVGTLQHLLLLPIAAMAAVYLRAITLEERKFASGPLAGEYARYRAEVGMLLPRL